MALKYFKNSCRKIWRYADKSRIFASALREKLHLKRQNKGSEKVFKKSSEKIWQFELFVVPLHRNSSESQLVASK